MEMEDKTAFEIDRAIKVLLGWHPEKCLDLILGRDHQVVFQGVEDPQINIAERRADKVWLVAEQGRGAVMHVEAMLEPKTSELPNFNTKAALLREVLKRPVVTVIIYLEKGRYETFPYMYETQTGALKNTHVFARILLWEYKDRILRGEFIEFAPFLVLCEDEPNVSLLDRTVQLISQVADEKKRKNLFSLAVMVAYRKFRDKEFLRKKFQEQRTMTQESDFLIDWLEEREQKGRETGRETGREEGKRVLLLALLTKKFGALSFELQEQINQLSGAKLDNLSLALLDLNNLKELEAWLENGKTTPSAN